jgi:hypothetical protein
MANRLRNAGNHQYADKLATKAGEYLEEAAALEAGKCQGRSDG